MNKYDLIVCGGGTAGSAAAYTAGKLGLKTLLIEKNIHLGGTITSGLVIPVMNSGENQINTDFYNDLIQELSEIDGQVTYQGNRGWFNPELTKVALDRLMKKAGVKVVFCSVVSKVKLIDNAIKSLSVYNSSIETLADRLSPHIETRYVIDATGNCEIGKICNCEFLNKKDEIQPASLRFIMGGIDIEKFGSWLKEYDKDSNVTTVEYVNGAVHLSTAYTWDNGKNWALKPLFEDAVQKGILEDKDRNYFQLFTVAGANGAVAFNCPRILDPLTSEAITEARQSIFRLSQFCKIYFPGFEKAFISNIADMLGIRVSNRIKGKYIYTIDDLREGKEFSHPVLRSNYPVDVHSKDKNNSTLEIVKEYSLPIESLMSKDINNLFIAGRCISADFMAQGALRVQASCFSMGEGIAKYISELI